MHNQQHMIRLRSRLLERNNSVASERVYAKLQTIIEKSESGAVSIKDAMINYPCVHDDGDFRLSEDLFCAIIGAWNARSTVVYLLERIQDAKAAHIVRYIPFSWMRRSVKFCADITEQAIVQNKFAVLEEMLPIFMNSRQSAQNMRSFFESLLRSSCRDCMGLALKTISYGKLRGLKSNGTADWLLEQLLCYSMYWCIPYLKGFIKNKNRYHQAICEYRQEIMDMAFGKFQLSPLFHEVIRYDAASVFFVENHLEYLRSLLEVPTSRYVIQRLLIEVCPARAFDHTSNMESMRSIYELFKTQQDRFFYLDALYHALRYTTQKNCFKTLMIGDLERSERARNQWIVWRVARYGR